MAGNGEGTPDPVVTREEGFDRTCGLLGLILKIP